MRRQGGFSLAELIVNTGLVAVLATVVLGVLIPGLRLGVSTYTHLELSQRVALAARQWAQDMSGCAPSGLTVSDQGLIAQPLSWVDEGAAPVWESGWIVYRREGQRLLRSYWTRVGGVTWDPLRATVPGPAQKAQVWAGAASRERVLLTSLSRYAVSWESSMVLVLELEVRDGQESWRIRRALRLQNEG